MHGRFHGRGNAFDAGAPGDATNCRMIDGLVVSAAAGNESAGHDRPLGDRIDLSVGSEQRGHQQQAPLKISGVADSRGRHVDLRAGLSKCRKRRGYHDTGGIGHNDRRWIDDQAHPLQGVGETLRAEHGGELVAGLVKPNHDAVTDQLVVAYAFDRYEIFQARRGRKRGGENQR